MEEQFKSDQSLVSVANIGFEALKIAATLLVGAVSALRRKVVVDLFGGAHSQIRGAINVDIAAESGLRVDILKGLPFKSGSVDEIFVSNPFIPGSPPGANAVNTYLEEAARVLKEGGRITITGNLKANKFAKIPSAAELERLGLRLVNEPGPISDPRIAGQKMINSTKKEAIRPESLQSYVLEKKGSK